MTPTDTRVTADGVYVPSDLDGALDVLFDGRRVWSVSLDDRSRAGGKKPVHVSWPAALERFLDGRAEVTLRHHQSGDVWFRDEVVFGQADTRVRVEDAGGRPLAVTKYGRLNHPFDATGRESVENYLDQVEEVLAVLGSIGIDGYVAWGTLLGAVRTGEMIGHDVDADVGYLSRHDNMPDVIRESFKIERALRARGWRVVRENAGYLALFMQQPDGTRRNLDVFAGWILDGWFYQIHDLRARLPRTAIEPLGTVTLEGRTFPAPAEPEAWLEAAYGEGWRTPDPAFSFPNNRAIRRRNFGWLGGLRGRRDSWGRHYAASKPTRRPSEFARWVKEQDDAQRPLVDLGSGEGADALWFAASGREVLGIDVVPAVVRRATGQAEARDVTARFQELNFADLRHALWLGAYLVRCGPTTIYSRRLVGAVEPTVEDNVWRTIGMAMRAGGRLFIEFLTEQSSAGDSPAAEPRQQGADPARVIAEIERRGGDVLSRHDVVDPADASGSPLCRLVAEWSP